MLPSVLLLSVATLLQSFTGHHMPTSGRLFSRNLRKTYPLAVRGEGCWILEAHKLFERVNAAGQNLRDALAPLQSHPNVGEVRGLGLLLGVEFVKDRTTRAPFPRELSISEKIRQACLEENVLTYPTQGCVDGLRGDHILLAPSFTISPEECALIVRALQSAVAKVFPG